MKNNKKIISLLLSILLLSSSVYANSNINNMEMETEIIGDLQPINSSYPFDFEVVSSSEDTAVIAFLADELNDSSFYLGVKGEKEEAECVGSGQYAVQIGTAYAFVFNYTINNERITYNGTLIAEDYDENGIIAKYTDVAVNKTYAGELTPSAKVSLMSNYSTLSSGEKDESEPNDTYSSADRTYDDYDNYGTLDIEDDVDWWKVEFDEDGEANFWLGNIPEDCDFDLYVYDEYGVDDGDYLARSRNGGNEQELITIEVEADVIYYAEIYSYDGSSDDYYTFRTKNYPYEEDDGDPFEINNTRNTAYEIYSEETIHATIHEPTDLDYYEFFVAELSEVEIELYDIPMNCDYDLELHDVDGPIDISNNGGNDDEYLSMELEEGWYYILVKPYNYSYSTTDYYELWLSISRVTAQFEIQHFYDEGFDTRHTNASSKIRNYQNTVTDILENGFNIDISYSRSAYTSLADECKIQVDQEVNTLNLANTCPHTADHVNRTKILDDFNNDITNKDDSTACVLWTGHIMKDNKISASRPLQRTIIITPKSTTNATTHENLSADWIERSNTYELLHEVSHLLSLYDHYCDLDQGASTCDNIDCYRCEHNLLVPPDCIMTDPEDVRECYALELYCAECIGKITDYTEYLVEIQ